MQYEKEKQKGKNSKKKQLQVKYNKTITQQKGEKRITIPKSTHHHVLGVKREIFIFIAFLQRACLKLYTI